MPYMDAMGLFHDQNKTCFCWRGSWLDLVDEFYHVASSLKWHFSLALLRIQGLALSQVLGGLLNLQEQT